MLVDLRRDAAAGTPMMARTPTVEAVLLEWLAAQKRRVSPTSYLRYESTIRLHLAGIHVLTVAELTPSAIERHMAAQSPAAARGALRILRAAIARAVESGTAQRNVAKLVAPPRRNVPVGRALTAREVRALLDRAADADDPYRPLWALLFGSGLRLGEAIGLRRSDIDVAGRTVRVEGSMRHQDARYRGSGPRLAINPPKTDAGRRIAPLAGFAARAIDELPKDAVWLFHRANGKPLNPSTVQRAFAVAVERADLPPMRLHDARHTAATLALASGATLDDVKRMLGHSSITITSDVYGHLVTGRQRAIADALDEAIG